MPEAGATRIALGVEYDGATLHGWQSQADGNTVQDILQAALSRVADERISVTAAGRTDAGVHALNQVVHFDTRVERPLNAWVRGTNAHLPPPVAVRWAQPVGGEFHARFSARARHYAYLLLNHPVRPALLHGRVGWHHAPLHAGTMQRALDHLLGEHDFSSFRAAECQAKSPVKTLHRARVRRCGEFLLFEFSAGGFLHHMVRNIVGAAIYVGDGRLPPEAMRDLLEARDRLRAPPTFAAAGLHFIGADYDPAWRLPVDGRIMAPFPFGNDEHGADAHQDLRPDPAP